MFAICLFASSCGIGADKSGSGEMKSSKTPTVLSSKEIAHQNNSITLEEFLDMRFTYVVEQNLPCLVYVENVMVNDIVRTFKESSVHVWADCEECDGVVDGDVKYSVLPDWVGTPTCRENECWIIGYVGFSPMFGASCYIGLDKMQSEWMLGKTLESNLIGIVKTPVIIRVDQFRKHDGFVIKADLVKILNE